MAPGSLLSSSTRRMSLSIKKITVAEDQERKIHFGCCNS
jgi:hypothetical protein